MPPPAPAMPGPARTVDVLSSTKSFANLLLPPAIEQALREAGFRRPSPVQEAALPLARTGADVIVQAKAGTGKTLVFAVTAVERVNLANGAPQVIVLAPTREIALQATETVELVAAALPPPGLCCGSFIGGLPVEEDEKQLRRSCHVAVGTTGRILSLIQRGALRTDAVRLLVLDEADKLLADGFLRDTLAILEAVPLRRQLLALSATYEPASLAHLRRLMGGKQQEVLLSADDTSLLGVRQCYKLLHTEQAACAQHTTRSAQQQQKRQQYKQQPGGKHASALPLDEQHPGSSAEQLEPRLAALLQLLSSLSFQQAVVFCKYRADAEAVAARLVAAGFPAAYLSAQRTQLQRIEALNALRDFRLRVAVTTDLAARGVDLERVNLVVNLALPADAATYMHRVGRAGRFGTRGVAVTLLEGPEELSRLQGYLSEVAGGEVSELPDLVPDEWYRQQQPAPPQAAASSASNGRAATPALGIMGPATPAGASPLASAATDSCDGGPLADIATASLWLDEEGEDAEVAADVAGGAALVQQHHHHQQQQQQGEEGSEGDVDLSYVVLPKPAAALNGARCPVAAAAASSGSAPPAAAGKPAAVSSLTAAVAAAAAAATASGAAAGASAASSGGSSAESDDDSWASTSDDEYSNSSESEAESRAADAATTGATPRPVSFKPLRRAGSAASSQSSRSSSGSSSANSGARQASPPAPIPGRHHLAPEPALWTNSYEDASTGLADAVSEGPPSPTSGGDAKVSTACTAGPAALATSSDEEPSFRDSWLTEEQKQCAAAEKERQRQKRQEEAAAAVASGFELRPFGRASRATAAAKAAKRAARASAVARQAQQAQHAQHGHYWDVVRSVEKDVQSRQPAKSASRSPAAGQFTSAAGSGGQPTAAARHLGQLVTPQEQEEEGAIVAAAPRQRRPLGSAQASAARRREEVESAARAAEEAEAAALQHMAGPQQTAEGAQTALSTVTDAAQVGLDASAAAHAAAAAAAAEQQRQWSEFWQMHYAYYGCYPAEGLYAAGPDSHGGSSEAAAAAASASGSPSSAAAVVDAGQLLPPPPAPPAPPPQLSASAWTCQNPPSADASGGEGAAGAGTADVGWVQVPAALLARYQQLEWEAWHRQYMEWQTLWEQYKSYWAELYAQQQQHQQDLQEQQQPQQY